MEVAKERHLYLPWGPTAVAIFDRLVRRSTAPEGYKEADIHPTARAKFIRRWVDTFRATGKLLDLPRSGRPKLVPARQVEKAVDVVRKVALPSMGDYNKTAIFQEILTACKCSTKTLWRAMRAVDPSISKRGLLEFRRPLSLEVRAMRVDQCLEWLYKGVRPVARGVEIRRTRGSKGILRVWFKPPLKSEPNCYQRPWLTKWALDVIWIDEKTFYVEPLDGMLWGVGLEARPSVVVPDVRKTKEGRW